MITGCPNPNPNCPYFNRNTPSPLRGEQTHGCYADTDHIIPRFMGKIAGATTLLKNYIRSSANKQQLCRWDHDSKTIEERDDLPEIPSERFMIDAIKASRARRKK